MKKILIGLIALSTMCSCSENVTRESGVVILDITHNGHEYVVFKAGYGATTLHSPDCPCQEEDRL